MAERIDGANIPELAKKVENLASIPATSANANPKPKDLNTRLKELINKAPVMLFMKGDPNQPRCGKLAIGLNLQ